MNDLKFCPMCGGTDVHNERNRHWICHDCGFDLYNNDAAAVGCIICNKEGDMLFEVRAKEPQKGFLALPGGFVDPDESAEQAVRRECFEEIGVNPVSVKYLCSFPNTYQYKMFTYKTCDLFFIAELPPEYELKAQESEVSGLVWKKVQSEADVQALPLAFHSAVLTLNCWLASRRNK